MERFSFIVAKLSITERRSAHLHETMRLAELSRYDRASSSKLHRFYGMDSISKKDAQRMNVLLHG